MRFVGEHFFFRAPRTFSFLPPDFFDLGALRGNETVFPFFNFIEQQSARDETIQSLLARRLTFDLQAGRPMQEHDAGGNFVHVLSAVAAGADERLFDVRLAHAERGHARSELIFLFETDRKRAHEFFLLRRRALSHLREIIRTYPFRKGIFHVIRRELRINFSGVNRFVQRHVEGGIFQPDLRNVIET